MIPKSSSCCFDCIDKNKIGAKYFFSEIIVITINVLEGSV
jgi:hypothetical protein